MNAHLIGALIVLVFALAMLACMVTPVRDALRARKARAARGEGLALVAHVSGGDARIDRVWDALDAPFAPADADEDASLLVDSWAGVDAFIAERNRINADLRMDAARVQAARLESPLGDRRERSVPCNPCMRPTMNYLATCNACLDKRAAKLVASFDKPMSDRGVYVRAIEAIVAHSDIV